jgi:hypothetical protein
VSPRSDGELSHRAKLGLDIFENRCVADSDRPPVDRTGGRKKLSRTERAAGTFNATGPSPLTCVNHAALAREPARHLIPKLRKASTPSIAERSASFGIAIMRLAFNKLFESGPDSAKTSQHSAIIQEAESKNGERREGQRLLARTGRRLANGVFEAAPPLAQAVEHERNIGLQWQDRLTI